MLEKLKSLFKKNKAEEPQEPMDLDAVMKKFDRESNTRIWEGVPKIIVQSVLAVFAVFCLYVTLFATWLDEIRLTSFMAFIVFLGFLVFPAKKDKQRVNFMPWYDIAAMVLGTASFLYYTFNAELIIKQGLNIEMYQVIIGVVGILALAEVCRRCVGLPILIVAGVLLIYAFVAGVTVPDFLRKLAYIVRNLFYSKEGVFGTPVNACSKFIAIFIIFGAFLERTGIADFFIKIANAFVGRFSGGPAKVAVIASALEGMVSGSSVGNTVGSGAVTIPLMKKAGYKPEFAAAAEASASTGGQIMPPIMGAAFLMAENLGVPYSKLIVCAILPAILYFAGVFITVHLEAKKEGLRGLTKEELPKLKPLLKQIYLLLPLILLVYLVSSGSKSLPFAAAMAILAAIVVGLINKEDRITPKRIFEALASGGQGVITVAAACGVAGIVAGVVTMTGLFDYLKAAIIAFSGEYVIVALFLTMICCIILGMGVPTTANYCIMAATCAPILIAMGVPDIAAHFFVFYFGIVADLTPPVALAAYAGAAIAQANPMKTALTSTKLAIGAFIIPYIFALSPDMLLIDTNAFDVILICITSLIGMFAVAAGIEGWFMHKMPWWQRIISIAGGLCLIVPGWQTDLVGVALVAIIAVIQFSTRRSYQKA